MAAADLTSTASRTRTLAPSVMAASACCCCLAGSCSAFEYRTSQSEQSSLTFFSNSGLSCFSYPVVLDSGSRRAIFAPPPPELLLLSLLLPQAAIPPAATSAASPPASLLHGLLNTIG